MGPIRRRRSTRIVLLAACCVLAALPAAGEWSWPSEFTPGSSETMKELHSTLHRTHALGDGVPVEDVHFRSDFFDLHMKSGAIWVEPPIDGDSPGAFFRGEATVSFTPDSKRARGDLELYLGGPSIDAMPLTEVYLFTLTGVPLTEQLGLDAARSVPLDSQAGYSLSKRAMRQAGTRFLHAFLNREAGAKGTVYALFAPEAIRTDNSPESFLLYGLDPQRPVEVKLEVFGHENFLDFHDYTYHFFTLTETTADSLPFQRPANVEDYRLVLDVSAQMGRVEEVAALDLTSEQPLSSLKLQLTSRLEVESVRLGADGDPLEFVQWKFLGDEINFDENLVVKFDPPLQPGQEFQLVVEAAGPLFDAGRLADEDTWHPFLDDRAGANYELTVTVPKNYRAVGAGELLDESTVDNNRRKFHYRTTRPHEHTTFYYGNYESRNEKADDTKIEVLLDRNLAELGGENIKFVAGEVANAVRVYNRILMPLELDQLRVAATPTSHGRGFEGLILVSGIAAGSISSSADLFRAHEVAHQWWGNMVQVENWPEDRWLMESTAEYSAMEYYQLRYEKPAKTTTQIREQWWQPTLQMPDVAFKTLTGEKRRERLSEISPLIAGDNNVYTKGPLVLHMLRYMFQVRQGNDQKFWMSLQDFIDKYKYQKAGTQDFIDIVESNIGGPIPWFWDQWLYGRRIPKVRWSHTVEKDGAQWKLTVQGEQEDTEFVLAIPVYIELGDGRKAQSPLILQGKSGTREMKLPSKPKKVSLNDNFEALVELTK